MEKKTESVGLGGIGVEVNLNLTGLRDGLNMLTDALKQTGEKASQQISNAVNKIKEAGVQNLKEASKKEGGKGEATETYNRTVSQLQAASDKGDAEAKKLLKELR